MKKPAKLLLLVCALSAVLVVLFVISKGSGTEETTLSEEDFLAQVRGSDVRTSSVATSGSILPPAGSNERPDIEVETNMYSLGLVPHDRVSEGEIMIYNRGTTELKIRKVTTSCGCTTGKMSTSIIPPGGEAPLMVRFDPFKIPNQYYSMKTLTLHTNDPIESKVYINVVANIIPEILIEPERADFGIIAEGEGSDLTIRLRQNGDAPFEILHLLVPTGGDIFSVDWEAVPESEREDPEKAEYILTAKVAPETSRGTYSSSIEVNTSINRASRLSISLSADVRGDYNLQPSAVRLRGVKPGEVLMGVLVLSASEPIEVDSVQVSNDIFAVSQHVNETATEVRFDLKIADASPDGIQKDKWKLNIRVNGESYMEMIDVVAKVDAGDAAT